MNDRSQIAIGIVGAVLAAICCAAPLLVIALGSVSLTAWLANAYDILVPAVVLLGLGLVAFVLYRCGAGVAGCDPVSRERDVKS